MRNAYTIIGFSLSLLLVGCGGGGGDTSVSPTPTTPVTPPSSNVNTWVAGQFTSSETLRHLCEVPRTGTNPYDDNKPYPDKPGTALQEKLWVRSYSHETYLWANELLDNDPALYDSVFSYFDQLKTTATTPSGKPKDNFHFYQSYEDYIKEAQSGVRSGYGIRWAFISNKPPRELRVAYTQTNSQAQQAGVMRGDTVLAIDGININDTTEQGINTLNRGLAPASGESHVFTLQKVSGETRDVTLIAADIQQTPVQNTKVIDASGKRVGYLQFNQFISVAQPDLINAVKQFSNAQIDALVLDMRYNGGGLLALSSQLGYMIAGPGRTANRVFNQSIDNGKGNVYSNANDTITGFYNREIDFDALVFKDTTLPNLDLNTVYILTTGNTCSASESLINALLGIDVNVVLIGNTTCGKPYGFFPTPNCGSVFYTIQFKSSNEKGFGDYSDGFSPSRTPLLATEVNGCVVNDDFDHALGSSEERLLSTALTHIATGTCPVSSGRPAKASSSTLEIQGIPLHNPDSILQSNAIDSAIREKH
ncbi:hypothetical protein PALB_20550 [Pseudoalteromonas luteoviolacea B = ATCC 29581]|nr:hypothetical protein PALB_20550 [Pseudoalteromonas luteoviolacea B = ATCC 29581]